MIKVSYLLSRDISYNIWLAIRMAKENMHMYVAMINFINNIVKKIYNE